jgi:hypothetical protein
MNNFPKKEGSDQDLRTFIKNQHKKFYSVCRLFASNYKEHQRLFFDIIAAVSFSIRNNRSEHEKQTLLLRACVNMSALHSISLGMEPAMDRSIQFKSPDYQRNMSRFRESVGEASDYDKILLFLGFEKVSADTISDLTGYVPAKREALRENSKKNFIPYLKEKLIWS